jgi:hypothetical protein
MSPFSAICLGTALALILVTEGMLLRRRQRKQDEKWKKYRAEWALRREAWRNRKS